MAQLTTNLTDFSLVTVMNVKLYSNTVSVASIFAATPATPAAPAATIDSLRISNISSEGPNKTYKGGLYADTLMRYGKTMRLEMEDVITTPTILKMMFGVDIGAPTATSYSVTDLYPETIRVLGETFVVDKLEWG